MPERPNNTEKPNTIDGIEPLSYEAFRYKPGEPDMNIRQSFNNFYFYFYSGKLASYSPIDVYLEKEWFKKFSQKHKDLLKETQEILSKHIQPGSTQPDLSVEDLNKQLYKSYLVARQYATDAEFFAK